MGLMLCFRALNGWDGGAGSGAVLLMVGHTLLLMLCFSSLLTHSVLASACQCLHGSFSHAQCCLLMASVWLLCAVDAVLFLVEPVLCCFCAIYAGVLLMLCSSWWSLFCASSVPFILCSRAASVVSFSLTLTSLERGILGLVLCT